MGQTRQLGGSIAARVLGEQRFVPAIVVRHEATKPVPQEIPGLLTIAPAPVIEDENPRPRLKIITPVRPKLRFMSFPLLLYEE